MVDFPELLVVVEGENIHSPLHISQIFFCKTMVYQISHQIAHSLVDKMMISHQIAYSLVLAHFDADGMNLFAGDGMNHWNIHWNNAD
jgi:hypothetical protein